MKLISWMDAHDVIETRIQEEVKRVQDAFAADPHLPDHARTAQDIGFGIRLRAMMDMAELMRDTGAKQYEEELRQEERAAYPLRMPAPIFPSSSVGD